MSVYDRKSAQGCRVLMLKSRKKRNKTFCNRSSAVEKKNLTVCFLNSLMFSTLTAFWIAKLHFSVTFLSSFLSCTKIKEECPHRLCIGNATSINFWVLIETTNNLRRCIRKYREKRERLVIFTQYPKIVLNSQTTMYDGEAFSYRYMSKYLLKSKI